MSDKLPDQIQTVAVIDIGSSAMRLVVAEISPSSNIRTIETLQKSVRFGKEVFTGGRLSNASMREGIEILKNFNEVIRSYGVSRVQAIATSAVREATNRDTFIDRIYVRTGIDVEIIEGPEENRLELIAVENALGDHIDLSTRNCLIVEVGSGSTEMIILNHGQVGITRTLSLGSIRLPEEAVAGKTDPSAMARILSRNIHDVAVYSARQYSLNQVDTFIALGGDMRFVSKQLRGEVADSFAVLEKKEFKDFVSKLSKMSLENIAQEFGIPFSQAETIYPALLVYLNFLGETKADQLIVPMVSIRDALLAELAQLFSKYRRTDVSKQVLNSARHLAEKYNYDKAHAAAVAALSLKLFDALQADHGMGPRERMLLEVSAVLHDIGNYISPSSHHKHSSYLVDAAEIFGLRKLDKTVVANVVRYHRKNVPQPTHVSYMSLPKSERAVVSKLAAILRVADSLDAGQQQKVKVFRLETTDDSYVLWIPAEIGDIAPERNSLKAKGRMFADVYGLPITLRQEEADRGN